MVHSLKIAVAGLGRMGTVHALNAAEVARETDGCVVSAMADLDRGRAERMAAEIGPQVGVFDSIEELTAPGICDAVVIVTPTENHRRHATAMLRAGKRVLLEKPLTGTLEGDIEFSAELERDSPQGLMLGFQRRFDAPMIYARELMRSGLIGRVFKIYTALEDSNPAPDGYKSGGILPDMAVHNIDEVLWLTGRMPTRANDRLAALQPCSDDVCGRFRRCAALVVV